MQILKEVRAVQERVKHWKLAGETVCLVPTMGCLHEGHLALVKKARELATKSVVSIFVNPLQFGPQEDFEKYPRTFDSDVARLTESGCDLLFAPRAAEFYPPGFSTRVNVSGVSEALEGRSRPGHFEGVATVVLKLLNVAQADYAVFGEKDYQQLRVIQTMVEDLNVPTQIVAHPTVREADGLARSSRNVYLSPTERAWAKKIPELQAFLRRRFREERAYSAGRLHDDARKFLADSPLKIDYVEVASARQITPFAEAEDLRGVAGPRVFIAVKAGPTRLIDNFDLGDRDDGATL